MQSWMRFGKILLVLALGSGLAACGGGGGGGTAAGAGAVVTTITGSAGDGPVTNGNVSVLDANGAAVTTTPANPTTGANAQFSFTVPSGTALPLTITVTGGTDTVTGAAQDFPLRTAVTTLPSSGTVTGNANPLSTLAVASAEAQAGGITTASLTAATNNVLGAVGFGLGAIGLGPRINPLSTPVDNNNAANIVRANEAAAELIRRASNANPGLNLADTITSIAQDLTDGVIDGQTATLAAGTTNLASATSASHILNQQAQVSAETLANNLRVTSPNGTTLVSGATSATTLNTAITTTGHTGNTSVVLPSQAFLDQTRAAINIANTLTGGGDVTLNNLLGGVNALTAGTLPLPDQQTSLTTLAGVAAFPTPVNIAANAAAAAAAATAAAADVTAPVAPTLTAPLAGLININTPTVSGSAEAAALVTVLNGSTSVGTAIANGAGAWTLTSSALADGAQTLTATATDAAGNTGPVSAGVTITVDTVAPTVTITTTSASPSNAAFTATLTFSEAVTGVTLADFVVGNGAAGTFAAVSGTVYTALITPAGQGAVTVDVAANAASDAAGNGNTVATQLSVTFDNVVPTIAITTTSASPTNAAFTATLTFSETVTGVTLADFVVGNGAAGTFAAVSGTVYTALITPAGQGAVTVDVAANAASDAAGNGNTVATQLSVTFDNIAPTVAISTTAVSPTNAAFTATLTFSETVTGVTLADFAVGNGAAGSFAAVSATVYTAVITPTAAGAVTVDVALNAATDAAGNGSTAATQLSITFDNVAPTVAITTPANPTNAPFTATLTFSETVTGVTVADFTVGNGAAGTFAAVSGTVYTSLITPAGQGAVTVDVAANAASDAAGNGNTVATQLSVTFDNVIPAAPTISTPTTGTLINTTASIAISGVAASAEAGATVTVKDGATTLGTAIAAGNGSWTFASGGLTEAAHSFTATQTDLAGNTGAASTAVTYTIDVTAPSAPSISTPVTGSFTTFVTPTVSGLAGSAEANATVNVYDTDGTTLLGTTTAAGDGSWSLSSSALATGSHTLTAKATDTAGNVSGPSTALNITINNIPRFAYVANRGNNTVSMYTVNNTTGQLRHNGYVAAGTTPSHVATDPVGKFLYVPNNGSNNVSAYTINQTTGLLTSVGTVLAGSTPDSVTIDPTGRFAYVGNQNSSNVSQYTINQTTGALIPSTPATVTAGTQPRRVTVDPSGRFAYVANLASSTVSEYTINQTSGVLTAIRAAISSHGTSPASVKADPTGRFVYVTNNSSNNIASYTINQATGALTFVQVLATGGAGTGEIAIDPAGTFVYVGNGPANNVATYSIDQATGALTSLGVTASAGTNTANISVDPSGKFVYAVDDGTKSLSVFSINSANGTLTLDASITTQSTPRGIVVTGGTTPVTYSPKFAYVSNQTSNDVSAYTVDQTTGVLTAVGAAIATGTNPRRISTDPLNRFVYVANMNSNDISAYRVNATTGELTSVGPTVATGALPFAASVDPSGRFVYVPNSGDNNVTAYTINQTTGALTSVGSTAAQAGLSNLSVDPSGRFAYATNGASASISAYTINQTTGLLISVGTVAAGTNATHVVVDPSGRFAYVANFTSNNISSYSIIQSTGALTLIDTAVTAGSGLREIAIDPSGKFAYVVSENTNSVLTYSINQNTGVLSSTGVPIATGTAPIAITIDSSGKFAYVANFTSNDLSAYTINQTTGRLTSIGTTVAAGTKPDSIIVTNTFDTVAPAQPAISSPTGGVTVNTNTPTVSGTAEPGSTITLSSGVTPPLTIVGTTTADAFGNWTLTSGPLNNGTHTLTVTATDAAGNVSIISAGITITVNGNPAITGAVVDGKVAGATLTLFSDQAMTTPNQVGSGSTDAVGSFTVILTVATAPDPIYIKSVGGTDLDTGLPAPTMNFVGNNTLGSFNVTPLTSSLFAAVANDTTGATAATKLSNAITAQAGKLNLGTASDLFLDPSLAGSPLTTVQAGATSSPLVQALTSGTVAGTISGSAAGTTYKLFALATGEGDIGVDIGTLGSTSLADVKGLIITADISVNATGTITGNNITGIPGATSITGKVQGSSIVLDITAGVSTTFITRVVGQIGLNGSISGNFTDIQTITTTPVMSKGVFVGSVIPSTGLNAAGIATFVSNFYSPGVGTGTMNIVAKDSFVSAGVPQVRWGQVDVLTANATTGATTMSDMTLRVDAGSVASTFDFSGTGNSAFAGLVTFTFAAGEYVKIGAPTAIPTNILIYEFTIPAALGVTPDKLYVATVLGLRRGIYMVINGANNLVTTIGESYMSKASSNLAPGLKSKPTVTTNYDFGLAFVHPGMVGGTRANAIGSGALAQPFSVGPIGIPAAATGFSPSNGFLDSNNTGGLLQELFVFQGSTLVMKKDAGLQTFNDNPFAAIMNGTFVPVDIPGFATATPEDHLRVVQFSDSGAIEGEGVFGGSFDHDNNPATPAIDMKGSPATFIGFFHDQAAGTPTFTGKLNFLARTMYATSFAGFSNAYINGSINILTPPSTATTGTATLIANQADGTPVNATLTIDALGTGFGIYHMNGPDAALGIYIDVYWPIGGTKATYIVSDAIGGGLGNGNVTEIGEAFITQ